MDNHKNLKSIKGSDELVRKLKDLFSDFEEHEEKLRYCDKVFFKCPLFLSICTQMLNTNVGSFFFITVQFTFSNQVDHLHLKLRLQKSSEPRNHYARCSEISYRSEQRQISLFLQDKSEK